MKKKNSIPKDLMYFKFCLYGFLKNQRFFDPFIILFFREMGMSFFHIGILFSIREIATNILEIPTGIIADSFGRRKSMIAAFSSYIIAFSIFYFFANFYMYVIAMIFYASGEAFRSGTHKAMILQYLKIKHIEHLKVEYYGHTRSFSQLGSAVSSIIAIIIVFYSGSYRPVFLISLIPYIMALILMITYPKYLDGEIKQFTGKWYEKSKQRFSFTIKSFFIMFTNKYALKSIFNSSVFDGLFKSSKDYLQPILKGQALALPILLYLSDNRRVALIVGIVYFILYFLTSIASRNAGKFVKKVKSISLAINTTYILGVLLLLFSGISIILKFYWLSSLLFVLYYIMQNLRRPMNVAFISDNIAHETMASGLSVESQLKTIIMAILAPIIGFLADKFSIGYALIIISILFIIIYPFIAVKSKTKTY